MANFIAVSGTNNWSGATTWGTCDTNSASIAGSTAANVTTSNLDSGTFTPGAITVDGILLNIANRVASPTGTMTVTLRNSTGGINVASVTVNNSDLPAMETSATAPGCWVFFKLTPTLLLGATLYLVRVTSSVTTQCALYGGAANNWNRLLRVSASYGTPGASDRLFISKELTGAGTSNAVTVTMDNNSTTSFGAIDITQATLQYSTAGNTQLRHAGNLNVWAGGTLSVGTSGTPVPVGTTAILQPDCGVTAVLYGLEARKGSTINMYGGSKTYWKSKLTADAASSATSLTIADSVGTNWKNGDVIALASTTTTAGQSESKALTADGSTTTLTITALTNSHLGTSPKQAEVANLTRNVKFFPASTGSTYINISGTDAAVNFSWAEFNLLGSATANKGGIQSAVTTGSLTMDKCSVHDFTNASAYGVFMTGTAHNNMTLTNNIFYNVYNYHVRVNLTSGTNWTISGNIFMLNNASSANPMIYLLDMGGTFTDNTLVSSTVSGTYSALELQEEATIGTISGNTAHSCANSGIGQASGNLACPNGTISTSTVWCCNYGLNLTSNPQNTTGSPSLIFNTVNLFSNTTANIVLLTQTCNPAIWIKNLTSNAGTVPACPIGISINNSGGSTNLLNLVSCTFGGTTTHSQADIDLTAGGVYLVQIYSWGSTFSSTTTIGSPTRMSNNSFFRSARDGNVPGAYRAIFKYGTVTRDGATYHSATGPAEALLPTVASPSYLQSATKTVNCLSGQAATVSVWINKEASYAGSQPRLMVRENDSAGITADTQIAVYSSGTGSWNQISGATAAVTENCTLEFYVDCADASGKRVWVDDWSAVVV